MNITSNLSYGVPSPAKIETAQWQENDRAQIGSAFARYQAWIENNMVHSQAVFIAVFAATLDKALAFVDSSWIMLQE